MSTPTSFGDDEIIKNVNAYIIFKGLNLITLFKTFINLLEYYFKYDTKLVAVVAEGVLLLCGKMK